MSEPEIIRVEINAGYFLKSILNKGYWAIALEGNLNACCYIISARDPQPVLVNWNVGLRCSAKIFLH